MTTHAQFHVANWMCPAAQLPAPICTSGDAWVFEDGSRLRHGSLGPIELPSAVAFRFKSLRITNDNWTVRLIAGNPNALRVLARDAEFVVIEFLGVL